MIETFFADKVSDYHIIILSADSGCVSIVLVLSWCLVLYNCDINVHGYAQNTFSW